MSEVKHTPGPWEVYQPSKSQEVALIRVAPKSSFPGNIVVASVAANPPESHWEGNAKLIAAAPDMLEALEFLIGILRTPYNGNPDHAAEYDAAFDRAVGAIAKATGKEEVA